jgi:hypothetical protein
VSDSHDERWTQLLEAARTWKSGLIPNTSTGLAGNTARLVEAIEAFDACTHPRLGWVFYVDGRVECSSCATFLDLVPPDEPG